MKISILLLAAVTMTGCANDRAKPESDTASSPETQHQTNRCAPDGTAITTGGVGAVQIGARMHDVRLACSVSDTSITLGEGMWERAHTVAVGGGQVVALTTGTVDTSVTRVIIGDARFTTDKGIGIGKTIGALRAAHGALCAMSGEGNDVWVAASLPGISFAADTVKTPADSSVISRIWVVGNPARCVPQGSGTRP